MEEKGGKREDCGTAPRTSWWLHQDALLSGGSRHGRHQQGASERRASPPAPEPPRCSLPLQVPRRPGRGCGMPAPSRAAGTAPASCATPVPPPEAPRQEGSLPGTRQPQQGPAPATANVQPLLTSSAPRAPSPDPHFSLELLAHCWKEVVETGNCVNGEPDSVFLSWAFADENSVYTSSRTPHTVASPSNVTCETPGQGV